MTVVPRMAAAAFPLRIPVTLFEPPSIPLCRPICFNDKNAAPPANSEQALSFAAGTQRFDDPVGTPGQAEPLTDTGRWEAVFGVADAEYRQQKGTETISSTGKHGTVPPNCSRGMRPH